MRIRNLLTLLPVAALFVPLAACGGGDSDSADGAKDTMENGAGEIEHGTKAGDKDSQGDGAGKGGGAKHE